MSATIDKVEDAFSALGLGQSPLMRGVAGFGVGCLISSAIRSDIMYKNGQARPWSMLSDDRDATPFPWWSPGLALGIAAGMFI